MSRLPHNDIWDCYYLKDKAVCPCCKKHMMYKNDHKTWNRSHIIRHRLGGADIYENVRPMCVGCNIADRKYPSNYAYMVEIGRMTPEECAKKVKALKDLFKVLIDEPDRLICEAHTKNGKGHRCTYSKKPHMHTCAIHGPTVREFLEDPPSEQKFYKVTPMGDDTNEVVVALKKIETPAKA
jgi:hypothetical protein